MSKFDYLDKPVTVICYNKEYKYEKRSQAIKFFMEAYKSCDPSSSEAERYTKIGHKLLLTKDERVTDE